MWLDIQELSTLEYLYDLKWIRASSDRGSTVTVSEVHSAHFEPLTATHGVFKAQSPNTKVYGSRRAESLRNSHPLVLARARSLVILQVPQLIFGAMFGS